MANFTFRTPGYNPEAENEIDNVNPLKAIIAKASKKYGIAEPVISAMIQKESAGNPNAKSGSGAMGLMQLMPETAKDLGVADPSDPEQNVMGGTKYFSQMLNKFEDPKLALAAYNSGPGNVKKYGMQIPPFKETQDYVSSIMGKLENDKGSNPSPVDSTPNTVATPTADLNKVNPKDPEILKMLGLDAETQKREKIGRLIDIIGNTVAGVSAFNNPDRAQQIFEGIGTREKEYKNLKAKRADDFLNLLKLGKESEPSLVKEYQAYQADEIKRGGKPLSLNDWALSRRRANLEAPIAQSKFEFEKMMKEKEQTLRERDQAFKENKANVEKVNKLPANQAAMLADGKNLPGMLDDLEKDLNLSTNLGGPIVGHIQGNNPYATKTQALQARIKGNAQVVGAFLEGGVLRKEDEIKYEKMLPNINDTPEVRAEKLSFVRGLIQKKYNEYLDSFGKAGYNVGNYETLGKSPTQQIPQPQPKQLSKEHQEALKWARENSNDPDAAAFLKKYGAQ